MHRLALAVLLFALPAAAQTTPLGLPMFNDPPESNGAPVAVRPSGILHNLNKTCTQMVKGSGWVCFANTDDLAAAKADAVAQGNAAVTAQAAAQTAALNSAVSTLNGRIDTVQASIPVVTPDTVCGNATVAGLSIPLTGISTTTTLTVTGVVQGAPCVVGNPGFLPLGAKGVCIASAANTVQMRFEAGGLLGSVLAIPNGTYRACVLVRP